MHLRDAEVLADLSLGHVLAEPHPDDLPLTLVQEFEKWGQCVEILHQFHRRIPVALDVAIGDGLGAAPIGPEGQIEEPAV